MSDTEKRYTVHSSFLTVQGEGYHAGRLAVFLRFNSCNVWDGREETRAQSKSACGKICDTKFFGVDESNGGGRFTASQIVARVKELWPRDPNAVDGQPFVVFTGGEPSLQVDKGLIAALNTELCAYVAMETNGAVWVPDLDWRTLSPKPPSPIALLPSRGAYWDEIKVNYPLYNPLDFEFLNVLYPKRLYISPVNYPVAMDVRQEVQPWSEKDVSRACVQFVKEHPEWRISPRMHLQLGVQ